MEKWRSGLVWGQVKGFVLLRRSKGKRKKEMRSRDSSEKTKGTWKSKEKGFLRESSKWKMGHLSASHAQRRFKTETQSKFTSSPSLISM